MTEHETWNGPALYQIKAVGRLVSQWTNWFEDLSVECRVKMTVISGRIIDQSALHGLLAKIRDLGMPIISVRSLDTDQDHKLTMKGVVI